MGDLGIAAIPVITIICYLIGEAVKLIPKAETKWIPVICGFCGGCLGVAAMYLMPDFPAKDILTAIAVGIVSGFAATGLHQAIKQLSGKHETENANEVPMDDL